MFFKYSFQKRIFLSYSAFVTLILCIFAGSVFIYMYNSQSASARNSKIQISAIVNEQIDTVVSELDRIVNGLLYNQEFKNLMLSGDLQIQHYAEMNKEIVGMFISLDAPKLSTYRIMVVNEFQYYTLTKARENNDFIRSKIKDLKKIPWFESLVEQRKNKLILPVHIDDWSEEPHKVFSVARNIIDNNDNILGFIEVQNDFAILDHINNIDPNVGHILLYDHEGNLQYPANQAESSKKKSYESIYKAIPPSASSGFFVKDRLEIAYNKSAYTGWTVVTFKKIDYVSGNVKYLILIIVFSLLILLTVSLFILKFITGKLTKPLLELNRSIKQVSMENLSLTIADYDQDMDEVRQLNKSFERMFTNLKQSVSRLVQARANEERANLFALQSQMSPHTIYNTISMIESLSYLNGNKEVAELCVHFSKLLRYISDFTEREYTVKDELQFLNNYAKLAGKRYEGYVHIFVVSDPKLNEKIVPKLSIQPIVENAIEHGLSQAQFPFTIRVTVGPTGNGWMIEVSDSGKGFSSDKLEQIQRALKQQAMNLVEGVDVVNTKIGGMGLLNIYSRFKMMYGSRFKFQIENGQSEGCKVTILIED